MPDVRPAKRTAAARFEVALERNPGNFRIPFSVRGLLGGGLGFSRWQIRWVVAVAVGFARSYELSLGLLRPSHFLAYVVSRVGNG